MQQNCKENQGNEKRRVHFTEVRCNWEGQPRAPVGSATVCFLSHTTVHSIIRYSLRKLLTFFCMQDITRDAFEGPSVSTESLASPILCISQPICQPQGQGCKVAPCNYPVCRFAICSCLLPPLVPHLPPRQGVLTTPPTHTHAKQTQVVANTGPPLQSVSASPQADTSEPSISGSRSAL